MYLDEYEQALLEGWEDVFKRGQLTIMIMLSLKDGPKHMAEIKAFMDQATKGSLHADDQSMYRALRRYNDAQLVSYTVEPGENGPDRKVYQLSEAGARVLDTFLERNIINTYYQSAVRELVERKDHSC